MGMTDYDEDDPPLENIARALYRIAKAFEEMNHGQHSPTALELIAIQLKDTIGPALESLAEAVREHGEEE